MHFRSIVAALLIAASVGEVFGQEADDDDEPADPDTGESTINESTLGLLPNPLRQYGIKFSATYIGETIGNVSGGIKQGAIYDGRLNLALDADLEKLAHLSQVNFSQVSFHANIFQIHGDGLSRDNLLNFLTVSGLEALPSTRLYEMWFEKKWDTRVSLRFGQLAADSEFLSAKYAGMFTNSSLGWPAITSVDLPSGGPSPPLAALGARLLINVNENLAVLGAIFDGDAAGPGLDDPQQRNRYGLNFRVNDPPLLLGQIQYAWNNKKGDRNLPGTLKIGGWRHLGDFTDQRFTTEGLSLVNPLSSGVPATLSGNFGIWGVIEQQIYRVPHSDDRGIGVFARVSSSPSDRNLIDLYADAGIEVIGLNDKRPNDKVGVAIAYAHISDRARALDVDFEQFVNASAPQRSFESLITAVYQYEIRTGWSVLPNFQYIVHPGGGATNPLGSIPGKPLKDAAVFGVRTVAKF